MKTGSLVITATFSACLMAVMATACLAYTKADVTRGEDLIIMRDYKGAIELLTGVTKDDDFCVNNQIDAAKAYMLLSDAYEAGGDSASDAYKNSVEAARAALVPLWAGLKKQEPDAKGRLAKMAEICSGHPVIFAAFLKQMLPSLMSSVPSLEKGNCLDSALASYRKVLASTLPVVSAPDPELLAKAGEQQVELGQYQKAIKNSEEALQNIPSGRRDIEFRCLLVLTPALFYTSDYKGVIVNCKRCFALDITDDVKKELRMILVPALEREEGLDAAVAVMQSGIDEEIIPEKKALGIMFIGEKYYTAKRYTEALQSFKNASKFDGANASTKIRSTYYLGLCNIELGNLDIARRYLNTVIASVPPNRWTERARQQLTSLSKSTP